MPRPQNKNLLPADPARLGQKALAEGEVSRPIRVRGQQAAVDWWESLSAEERGQIVEQLWRERGRLNPSL